MVHIFSSFSLGFTQSICTVEEEPELREQERIWPDTHLVLVSSGYDRYLKLRLPLIGHFHGFY